MEVEKEISIDDLKEWVVVDSQEREVDKEGRVKEKVIRGEHYAGLEVWAISPGLYKGKKDAYSKKIIESKTENLSDFFYDKIKDVYDSFDKEFGLSNFEWVIPIPTSKPNQDISPTLRPVGEKLAEETKKIFAPVIEKVGLSSSKVRDVETRHNDVSNSMKINCEAYKVKGKNIILLDDLRASGTTILECTKILREAGCGKVIAICLSIND
jgi:hypothetical protein